MRDMSHSTQEEQISYWTNYFSGMAVKTLNTFNYKLPIDPDATKDIKNPKEGMLNNAVKKSIDYYLNTPLDKGGAVLDLEMIVSGSLNHSLVMAKQK